MTEPIRTGVSSARPESESRQSPSKADLCRLAARGLVPMLDPESQTYCCIYNRTSAGMVREGLSPRYTLMVLLGLHRYQQAGHTLPLPTEPTLEALLRDLKWVDNTGDLGLLLWTCAELAPHVLPDLYSRIAADQALERYPDGRRGNTMEVAWYLTGLATCAISGYGDLPGLRDQAAQARRVLAASCGPTGVHGHFSRSGSLSNSLRGRIGSFADQVYPTIALARASRAWGEEETRAAALATAQTMCRLQGPQGEWSWQYDSPSGRVVTRYPVYSVHQHAMGPMMLLEASEATGVDFTAAIDRGLAWISGANELHRNFVEPDLLLVWRSIFLRRADALADCVLRFPGIRTGTASSAKLQVCYECRPYELGWLLYAFGRFRSDCGAAQFTPAGTELTAPATAVG